ncbi:hypothetical protein BX600DRAFT_242314 [Xylariales sp. PMI_506]|nr:hypothetical protein BX600DRAFT_242314 [Xylariales sp. PMI_506]
MLCMVKLPHVDPRWTVLAPSRAPREAGIRPGIRVRWKAVSFASVLSLLVARLHRAALKSNQVECGSCSRGCFWSFAGGMEKSQGVRITQGTLLCFLFPPLFTLSPISPVTHTLLKHACTYWTVRTYPIWTPPIGGVHDWPKKRRRAHCLKVLDLYGNRVRG